MRTKICPTKALNLCLSLLAQKLRALNSPLMFFLTAHTENEFGEECVTLWYPALLLNGVENKLWSCIMNCLDFSSQDEVWILSHRYKVWLNLTQHL